MTLRVRRTLETFRRRPPARPFCSVQSSTAGISTIRARRILALLMISGLMSTSMAHKLSDRMNGPS